MAATYGCFAKVNLFNILSDLTAFSGDLESSGFWEFLVQEFPSFSIPVDDKLPQSAEYGTEAAMSMLKTGIVLITKDIINSGTNNPGSILYQDRTNDANSYITFLSMSLMGSLMYRYGAPYSNHKKSVSLPWTTDPTTVAGDGCALASAVLNFYDGISFMQSAATSGSISTQYKKIQTFLAAGLDNACALGCSTYCGAGVCSVCPTSLRNWKSCTTGVADANSCASLGLVAFINASWDTGP